MTPRAARLAVLLVASLALGGCSLLASGGSTGESGAPALDAPPATGATITGDGYSYQVPEGWATPADGIPGFDPDSVAIDQTDADGFSDNVNVLLSPAGEVTSDQVETLGVTELENAGATDVSVESRVSVAESVLATWTWAGS